jgi:replicative DNA helicase
MSNTNSRGKRGPSIIDPNALIGLSDQLPDYDLAIEQAVLGGILLEKQAIDDVVTILPGPEVFYLDKHMAIYEAILELYGENSVIDLLTTCNKLITTKRMERVGNAFDVTKITNSVVSSAHIRTHCLIILQKWMKRQLGRLGAELYSMSFDREVDDLKIIQNAEKKIMDITGAMIISPYSNLDQPVVEVIKRVEAARTSESNFIGVPTGYADLDRITRGWRNTDLIILAARPSVGKTAFAINLARNAATHPTNPTKVGIFSLEMGKNQLVERLVAMETGIDLDRIIMGRMDDQTMDRLYKATKHIVSIPILIDDSASLNIFELKSKVRRMKREGVGLVIIDYLQLMTGINNEKGNREQEISTISRNLKILAKESNIPIIALSQLSREVEKRKDPEPKLADLRESGAIEQDADLVMFLFRPEYHDITADEMGESTLGQTIVKIAKHRNGSLGRITLQANLSIQKFVEQGYASGPISQTTKNSGNHWRPIQDDEKSWNF